MQLANSLFVTKQAVSKWENDQSLPDLTLLPQIVNTLGISYNNLITESEMKMYNDHEKQELLSRCIDEAANANKICDMLDRWDLENKEIGERERLKLHELGKDINWPIISFSDIDILGIWDEIRLKRLDEFHELREEIGDSHMPYIYMILYLGEDLYHGTWELPNENDPSYPGSVCDLLLTDQDDYNRINNPGYEIEDKYPDLVASWIRMGLSALIKAKR